MEQFNVQDFLSSMLEIISACNDVAEKKDLFSNQIKHIYIFLEKASILEPPENVDIFLQDFKDYVDILLNSPPKEKLNSECSISSVDIIKRLITVYSRFLQHDAKECYFEALLSIMDHKNVIFNSDMKNMEQLLSEVKSFQYVMVSQGSQSMIALSVLEHFTSEKALESLLVYVKECGSVDSFMIVVEWFHTWKKFLRNATDTHWKNELGRIRGSLDLTNASLQDIVKLDCLDGLDQTENFLQKTILKHLESRNPEDVGIALRLIAEHIHSKNDVPCEINEFLGSCFRHEDLKLTDQFEGILRWIVMNDRLTKKQKSFESFIKESKLSKNGVKLLINIMDHYDHIKNHVYQSVLDLIKSKTLTLTDDTLSLCTYLGYKQGQLLDWILHSIIFTNGDVSSAVSYIKKGVDIKSMETKLKTLKGDPAIKTSQIVLILSLLNCFPPNNVLLANAIVYSLEESLKSSDHDIVNTHFVLLKQYINHKAISKAPLKNLITIICNTKQYFEELFEILELTISKYKNNYDTIINSLITKSKTIHEDYHGRILNLLCLAYIKTNEKGDAIILNQDRLARQAFPMFLVVSEMSSLDKFLKFLLDNQHCSNYSFALDIIVNALFIHDGHPDTNYIRDKEKKFLELLKPYRGKRVIVSLVVRFLQCRVSDIYPYIDKESFAKIDLIEGFMQNFDLTGSVAYSLLKRCHWNQELAADILFSDNTSTEVEVPSLHIHLDDTFKSAILDLCPEDVGVASSVFDLLFLNPNVEISDYSKDLKVDKDILEKRFSQLALNAEDVETEDLSMEIEQDEDNDSDSTKHYDSIEDLIANVSNHIATGSNDLFKNICASVQSIENSLITDFSLDSLDIRASYVRMLVSLLDHASFEVLVKEHITKMCFNDTIGKSYFLAIYDAALNVSDPELIEVDYLISFEHVLRVGGTDRHRHTISNELVTKWFKYFQEGNHESLEIFSLIGLQSALKLSIGSDLIDDHFTNKLLSICFSCKSANYWLKDLSLSCLLEVYREKKDGSLLKRLLEKLNEREIVNPRELLDDPRIPVKKPSLTPGLENLGSTCYINSLVQYFFSIPELCYGIMAVNDVGDPMDEPSDLLHELKDLLAKLELSNRASLDTKRLAKSLSVNVNVQGDIDELFTTIRDRLEDRLSSNIFKEIFGGSLEQRVICSNNSEHVVKQEEEIFSLRLDVQNNINCLEDSLDHFFETENIEGFECDQCNAKFNASKFYRLKTMPNRLFIQLKRIAFDQFTGELKKYNNRVAFPNDLDLQRFATEDCNDCHEYSLDGVIVHSGAENQGHYYVLIKKGSQWFKYNDKIVSEFDEANMEKECFGSSPDRMMYDTGTSAYILMYTKKTPYYPKKIQENIGRKEDLLRPWALDISKENDDMKEHAYFYTDNYLSFILSFQRHYREHHKLDSCTLDVLTLLTNIAFDKLVKIKNESMFEQYCQEIIDICHKDCEISFPKYVIWVLSDQKHTWLMSSLLKTSSEQIKTIAISLIDHCLKQLKPQHDRIAKVNRKKQMTLAPKNVRELKIVDKFETSLLYVFDKALNSQKLTYVFKALLSLISLHRDHLHNNLKDLYDKLITHYFNSQKNIELAAKKQNLDETCELVALIDQIIEPREIPANQIGDLYEFLCQCLNRIYNIPVAKRIASKCEEQMDYHHDDFKEIHDKMKKLI